MNKNYFKLPDSERKDILHNKYHKENMSFEAIAKLLGTYQNKVRRDAIKLGIKIKNKSTAQKQALQTGRHKHPTKGTQRPDNTKVLISDKLGQAWENISDEEKASRSEAGKEAWKNRSTINKIKTHKKSHKAILQTAKTGSKLEHCLSKGLLKAGYKVSVHQKHIMQKEQLEIDILIPELNVAIEVDGPSHHKPIWGEKAFKRTQRADKEKNGLILGKGMVLIRVACDKSPSSYIQRNLLAALLARLDGVKKKFPEGSDRFITIGEIDDK